MLPVFLSTPGTDTPISLPFRFAGGFGLSVKEVGFILSMQGVYSMIATVVLFPIVVRKLGALRLFQLTALSYPLLYLVTPYLVLLSEPVRTVGVYIIILWKCTFANLAFPAMAILLANAVPSALVLGTVNGVSASTASLSRAFGPTVSGFLYSRGLSAGYSGLAWWVTGLITIIGSIIALQMEDKPGRLDEKIDEDEEALRMECTTTS